MKFSIKLQDILHAYIDDPKRRYLCLLINDVFFNEDALNLECCSYDVRDFFTKYFKCHSQHIAISILGWFVCFDGDTAFVETINGERLLVDTTRTQSVRIAMMQYILKIDPDATIIIDDTTEN